MTIEWPAVLKARQIDPHLRNFARSGGRTLSGREQRVFSDAGYWEIAIDGIVVRNRVQAAAYRALIARLRQGDDILLPICDRYTPLGARPPGASAVLAANATMRATTLALTVTNIDLQAGHYFSIGDRLHLVERIVSGPVTPPFVNPLTVPGGVWSDARPWTDSTAGSAAYAVRVLPALRAAAPAGTPVSFAVPVLRCELKDMAGGDLTLDLGRIGFPSLSLIESI